MNTAAAAVMPEEIEVGMFEGGRSEIITAKPEEGVLVSVLTVGDVMTMAQKQGRFRLGGRLFLDSHCLEDWIVPRCAITPLQEGMMSVSSGMIAENERKNYISSFTKTNVRRFNRQITQWERRDVEVGKNETSKHLLYKRILPMQEIGQITRNGVVQVSGITRVEDIREAQYHYFPNWTRILQGLDLLPVRLRELQEHLYNRMATAMSDQLKAVGYSFINSCDQFRAWGTAYVKNQTDEIEKVKGTPVFQKYDEIAESLFPVLELTRQDSLIENLARQQNDTTGSNDKIATAISLMTEILARSQDPLAVSVAIPDGLDKLASNPPSAVSDQPEASEVSGVAEVSATATSQGMPIPEVAVVRCSVTTALGEQCKRAAEADGTCAIPAHKKAGKEVAGVSEASEVSEVEVGEVVVS